MRSRETSIQSRLCGPRDRLLAAADDILRRVARTARAHLQSRPRRPAADAGGERAGARRARPRQHAHLIAILQHSFIIRPSTFIQHSTLSIQHCSDRNHRRRHIGPRSRVRAFRATRPVRAARGVDPPRRSRPHRHHPRMYSRRRRRLHPHDETSRPASLRGARTHVRG